MLVSDSDRKTTPVCLSIRMCVRENESGREREREREREGERESVK